MSEENTAEVMEEPDDQSGVPDDIQPATETGEVSLGDDTPESAANQTEPVVSKPGVAESAMAEAARPAVAGSAGGTDMATTDLSLILDIPVTLSMEIGQTRITINELLKLGKDSVIELQRMTDEPLDVLVNGTLVAHGEAVVVGDRFGIRLTDVISPQERLKKFS
ncbi:MAG: flagellar motor switch protein FliN [Granulosicoccus sp.]|nr:flagellar motor switch protein FliN [Granulosicoccus sp.]